MAQVMYAQRPIQARAPAQRPHHLSKVRLIQCHQRRVSVLAATKTWQGGSEIAVKRQLGFIADGYRPHAPIFAEDRERARLEVVIGEGAHFARTQAHLQQERQHQPLVGILCQTGIP